MAMDLVATQKRLSCPVDEDSDRFVSLIVNLDPMKELLGSRLYNATAASRMGVGEGSSLARTLPMNLARASDLDFVLEICICPSHGRTIEEEMRAMKSVEDWPSTSNTSPASV
jgi:hypothetical protein